MSELASTNDMIAMQARIFDDVRPVGARLFLLKRAGQTRKFTIVASITAGWNVVFDKEFRDEMRVAIATSTDISNNIAQSSFVAYGIGTTGTEIDVFSFEKKDSTRPNATSPSWKIHCRREAVEFFVIP